MSARLIGRTGATAGQDFVLMDVATIGASAENEIRIAAPGVSRRHARVVKDKDQYFLEDAGATNGTFLNGGRVQREALQHLDVITLGRNVDLIFVKREGDTAAPKTDAITGARLQIADGAEAGTVVDVPKGEVTIGRAPSCNVVLASGLISKVHARIQRTANQVVLQDLQSINGTFVNGVRVDSVVVLKNGDTINFAGVRSATVTIEGAGAAKAGAPAMTADEPAFNQEWKTRFVWAPDELALIEQARAEAMQLAALRAPAAGPAADKKAPAAKPAAPAAPKPAPPVASKAAGAQPPPNPAGKQSPPVAAEAKPDVAPAPVTPGEVKPPPVPRTPIAPKPVEAVKPAGPAQAVVQSAEAPIKPGSPVPVKPDPASATKPETPQPATLAEAQKRAEAPKASPPAAPPRPAAPPKVDEVVTMAVKASDLGVADVTTPMVAKTPRVRGIRLIGSGAPIALGVGTFVVGRAVGSDVRLDDRQVSRSHALITVDDASAWIEDLQTVNGTLLNGSEVKARQPLKAGDTIQFGASQFKVELARS